MVSGDGPLRQFIVVKQVDPVIWEEKGKVDLPGAHSTL